MGIQTDIETVLKTRFDPIHLAVVNESHMHNVPPGSESHFKVELVAAGFEGARAVQRHQAVYAALGELMNRIHALALHTYTPAEWDVSGALSPDSPLCRGGSKSP